VKKKLHDLFAGGLPGLSIWLKRRRPGEPKAATPQGIQNQGRTLMRLGSPNRQAVRSDQIVAS